MNTEKHIRLAALDLDGTTLRSDKSLSEYTIETLKNAHEHGMHIVVASGRSFASLPEQVIQFPWAEYAITSNGAAVYEIHTGKRLRECRLNPEVVEKLLSIAEENHVMVEGFVDGVPYSARAYVENPVLFGASLYSVSYVPAARWKIFLHFCWSTKKNWTVWILLWEMNGPKQHYEESYLSR